MTYRGAMLNIHKYRLRASSCPDIYRNSMITIDKSDEKVRNNNCLRPVQTRSKMGARRHLPTVRVGICLRFVLAKMLHSASRT